MATKRIRASTAKCDIDNAFSVWRSAARRDLIETGGYDHCEVEANDAKERVAAWLKQVEADADRLHRAMIACQAMVAVHPAAESAAYAKARRLAKKAIEG